MFAAATFTTVPNWTQLKCPNAHRRKTPGQDVNPGAPGTAAALQSRSYWTRVLTETEGKISSRLCLNE